MVYSRGLHVWAWNTTWALCEVGCAVLYHRRPWPRHYVYYSRLPSSLISWWRHQLETFSALLVFVRGIHRGPVNSPHKGQWRGALMFFFICVWINDWVSNREAVDLRRYRAHYDVTLMIVIVTIIIIIIIISIVIIIILTVIFIIIFITTLNHYHHYNYHYYYYCYYVYHYHHCHHHYYCYYYHYFH